MEFDVFVSPDDYRRALLLHSRLSRRSSVLITAAYLALAILAIALYLRGSVLGVLIFTPTLVFPVGRTIIRLVFLPGTALQTYSQQRMLHAPCHYHATDASLNGSNEYGQTALPWDHFVKWKADSQLVLLYMTPSQFMVVPKRCIGGGEQQAFTDLLNRVGIPAA